MKEEIENEARSWARKQAGFILDKEDGFIAGAEWQASQTQPAQSLIDDIKKIVAVDGDIMDIRIHVGKVYGTGTYTDELLHALEMKIFKMLDKYAPSTPTDHD